MIQPFKTRCATTETLPSSSRFRLSDGNSQQLLNPSNISFQQSHQRYLEWKHVHLVGLSSCVSSVVNLGASVWSSSFTWCKTNSGWNCGRQMFYMTVGGLVEEHLLIVRHCYHHGPCWSRNNSTLDRFLKKHKHFNQQQMWQKFPESRPESTGSWQGGLDCTPLTSNMLKTINTRWEWKIRDLSFWWNSQNREHWCSPTCVSSPCYLQTS